MDNNLTAGLLSLVAGAVFTMAALFLFGEREKKVPLSLELQEMFPAPDPTDHQPHMVFCMAPWGEIVKMFFTADQWQMLHQLVKISGESLDSLINQIAAERFEDPREF